MTATRTAVDRIRSLAAVLHDRATADRIMDVNTFYDVADLLVEAADEVPADGAADELPTRAALALLDAFDRPKHSARHHYLREVIRYATAPLTGETPELRALAPVHKRHVDEAARITSEIATAALALGIAPDDEARYSLFGELVDLHAQHTRLAEVLADARYMAWRHG
jgi:hypothetical protein